MRLRHPALALAALGLSLSACTTMTGDGIDPPAMGNGECDAGAAQGLVGETASAETGQQALSLTGARQLRWGPPDTAFTMDYRPDRLNVIYDRAMTITQVTCG